MLRVTLETALIIGFLFNLIKAGDLILRPHQQARVQAWFEHLTLVVDDIEPITWLNKLRSRRAYIVVVLVGALEFGLAVFLTRSLRSSPIDFASERSFSIPPRDPFHLLVAILCSISVIVCTARRFGPIFLPWLLGPPPHRGILVRFLVSLGLGTVMLLVLNALVVGLFFWLIEHFDSGDDNWKAALFSVMVVPMVTWLALIAQLGAVILLLMLALLFADFFLKSVGALCWRVAEYNKGATSAIILVLTLALGVARWAVESRTPEKAPEPTTTSVTTPAAPTSRSP